MQKNLFSIKKEYIFQPLIIGEQYDKTEIFIYFRELKRQGKDQVAFKYSEKDFKSYMFNAENVFNNLKGIGYGNVQSIGWKSRAEGRISIDVRYYKQ